MGAAPVPGAVVRHSSSALSFWLRACSPCPPRRRRPETGPAAHCRLSCGRSSSARPPRVSTGRGSFACVSGALTRSFSTPRDCRPPRGAVALPSCSCRAARASVLPEGSAKKPCALKTSSRKSALRLAKKKGPKDLVVVRVTGPGAVRSLMASGGRILAIAPLRGRLDTRLWRDAIGAAADSPTLDLGIAPTGTLQTKATDSYAALLGPSRQDTKPPTVPSRLTAWQPSATGITLGWRASNDNRHVAGYGVSTGRWSTTSSRSLTRMPASPARDLPPLGRCVRRRR